MNVTFYGTASDKRKLEKNLVTIHSESITMKDDNNITDVYLKIKTFSNWNQVNYVYIDTFGRYYYAEPEPLVGGMVGFKCHVDVLMSNANAIKSMQAIISRSAAVPSDYLVDDEQPLLNYRCQSIINFPLSMAFSTSLTYVLAVAGGEGSV